MSVSSKVSYKHLGCHTFDEPHEIAEFGNNRLEKVMLGSKHIVDIGIKLLMINTYIKSSDSKV